MPPKKAFQCLIDLSRMHDRRNLGFARAAVQVPGAWPAHRFVWDCAGGTLPAGLAKPRAGGRSRSHGLAGAHVKTRVTEKIASTARRRPRLPFSLRRARGRCSGVPWAATRSFEWKHHGLERESPQGPGAFSMAVAEILISRAYISGSNDFFPI